MAFDNLKEGDVVYCDPPYSPINRTSNFTAYSATGFTDDDQNRLVACALAAKTKGITTLISNHHTTFTEKLYSSADKKELFSVQRSISQNGKKRDRVEEVFSTLFIIV